MATQTFSDQEWQTLHEEIQTRLHALANEIQFAAPSTQPRYGKTVTKLFPLFSHVSFPLQTAGKINDIIIGVDIGPETDQWRIDADICEEEEGTIYFELPNAPFSVTSFAELRERALIATDELVFGGKRVLLRLFESSAPVPPNFGGAVPEVARKAHV